VGKSHLLSLAGAVRMQGGGGGCGSTSNSPRNSGKNNTVDNNNNDNNNNNNSSSNTSNKGNGIVLADGRLHDDGMAPIPVKDRSKLAEKVSRVWEERLGGGTRRCAPQGRDDFVVSVEVNPAAGLSVERWVISIPVLFHIFAYIRRYVLYSVYIYRATGAIGSPSFSLVINDIITTHTYTRTHAFVQYRRVNNAKMLLGAGVDVVNIADGPRATVRMSNVALGLSIKREIPDSEVILHLCCRDRNLLGLQSGMCQFHAPHSSTYRFIHLSSDHT